MLAEPYITHKKNFVYRQKINKYNMMYVCVHFKWVIMKYLLGFF